MQSGVQGEQYERFRDVDTRKKMSAMLSQSIFWDRERQSDIERNRIKLGSPVKLGDSDRQ